MPAAICLLNRRKFDAVIVDLQLGEKAGQILDAVRLSPANRTAVTFAISGSDAEDTAIRKRSEFAFERPLSTRVNPQYTQACLRPDTERAAALFSVSDLSPRCDP